MSITDELREYATVSWEPWAEARERLLWMCDRIDAEHERVRAESIIDMTDESMAEHGWIRLPVDADGEYIRVGDVMEWVDIEGKVTVTCTVDAVGVGCFFAWDNASGRFAQKCANAYRHYHAPTVEDVLREFALKAAGRECMTMRSDLVDEYASKLQLREDA